MKRFLALGACVCLLAVAATAQDKEEGKASKKGEKKACCAKLSDPLEILKAADAAAKKVMAVKYEFMIEPEGGLKQVVGKAEGTMIMSGMLRIGGRPSIEKYRADVKMQTPNSDEMVRLTGGTDGENFYVIRHAEKMAHEDIDPSVMGPLARPLQSGFMIEYLIDGPFNDEINGREREFKGVEKVAGEDCYVVRVVYQSEGAPPATWYFSVKDNLPRKRVDEYKLQDGTTGTLAKTVRKLEINPKLADEAFALNLPEGYTRTEDFYEP